MVLRTCLNMLCFTVLGFKVSCMSVSLSTGSMGWMHSRYMP